MQNEDSTSKNVEKLGKEYLPFLDPEERKTVLHFSSTLHDTHTSQHQQAKDQLILMLKSILSQFFALPVNATMRKVHRAKLLNLSGLHHLIPLEEIKNKLNGIRPDKTSGLPVSACNEDMIYMQDTEITSDMLQYCENLYNLLDISEKNGQTYYRYITHYADFIMFKSSLADELKSAKYVSASSDPLSRTILINTRTSQNEERDTFSMAFDLVAQSTFLQTYYDSPHLYKPAVCERLARIKALEFAKKVRVNLKESVDTHGEFAFMSQNTPVKLSTVSEYTAYFRFIDTLIADNEAVVKNLNRYLGYSEIAPA